MPCRNTGVNAVPANRYGLSRAGQKLARRMPPGTRCCGERNGKSVPKVIRRRFVPPLPRSLTGRPCKARLTHALQDENLNSFTNLGRPSIRVEAGAAEPLKPLCEFTRIRFPCHFSDSACGESRHGQDYMLRRTKPESPGVTDSSLIRSRLVPSLNRAPWLRVVFPFASAHKSLCVAGPLAPDRRTSRPPQTDAAPTDYETQSQKGHVPIR